jgi:hypothetical protein
MADLTELRPWNLQIQNRAEKSPWNPWNIDNPEVSENSEPVTPGLLKTILNQLNTPQNNRFYEYE